MNRVLLIIPAYNEEENIESVVRSIQQECPQVDFVVVNDGSLDGTVGLCRQHRFPLIDFPVNLGLAAGFQAGMKYAYGKGYDMAVQFDGDGQHDPSYLADMVAEMRETGADIVIGSRFLEHARPLRLRTLGSRLIQGAIWLSAGRTLTDPTSGLRLFNRRMIREFACTMNYGPEPDTLAFLLRNGVTIREVPVTMRERTAGTSYLRFGQAFLYMVNICVSILALQWARKRDAG